MRMVYVVFLLLATGAFAADGTSGAANSRVSRGNFLRTPSYKTTGTTSWFLDPAGSDTNDCASAGSACATIIGLQAKMPKLVRNPVTITVANGNYTGGWFTNFQFDPADATTGAYIVLQGSLTTFAPATGTASGTASAGQACAAGPPLVESTLTDGTQTWTTNNLKGQLVTTTGGTGSGQTMPIDSNTATVITLAGCWGVTPDNTTTYTIQDWGAVINTPTNLPPDFKNSAGNAIGLGLFNLQSSVRNNNAAFFFVNQVRVTVSTFIGAIFVHNSAVYAQNSRFDSTSGGAGTYVQGNTRFNFVQSVATSSSGQALFESAFEGPQTLRMLNSYFEAGSTNSVISLSGFSGSASNNSARSTNNASLAVLYIQDWVAGADFQGLRLKCTTGGSTAGILAVTSSRATPFIPTGPVGIALEKGSFNECPIAVDASGAGILITVDRSTFQATAGTTAIEVDTGAAVNLDSTSVISGSYTNQISMDGVFYTFAAFRAFSPQVIMNAYGTRLIGIP